MPTYEGVAAVLYEVDGGADVGRVKPRHAVDDEGPHARSQPGLQPQFGHSIGSPAPIGTR